MAPRVALVNRARRRRLTLGAEGGGVRDRRIQSAAELRAAT
jgi:hypothetical protein